MSIPRAYIKLSVALALTSVMLFTTSAFGQSAATGQTARTKSPLLRDPGWETRRIKLLLRHKIRHRTTKSRLRAQAKRSGNEIEAMKAENAAVRTTSQDGGAAEDTCLNRSTVCSDDLMGQRNGGMIVGQPVGPAKRQMPRRRQRMPR